MAGCVLVEPRRRAATVVFAAWVGLIVSANSRAAEPRPAASAEFPAELTAWRSAAGGPVFTARGPGHWDCSLRERGWILVENGEYRLWYTGYDGTRRGVKRVGYATSPDGVRWTRAADGPLVADHWIEDMMVVKSDDAYYMFAEGARDGHSELLTSTDGLSWTWEGPLEIRTADGRGVVAEPCGTPTVWVEDGVWRLFYERHDLGVWLAVSTDPRSRVWTNVQNEPVLAPGPDDYDKTMIALDQVIECQGAYYAFYHSCGEESPRAWSTNVARSTDLVQWQKFAGNPIVEGKSSAIVVPDGRKLRLYAMHGQVELFESTAAIQDHTGAASAGGR